MEILIREPGEGKHIIGTANGQKKRHLTPIRGSSTPEEEIRGKERKARGGRGVRFRKKRGYFCIVGNEGATGRQDAHISFSTSCERKKKKVNCGKPSLNSRKRPQREKTKYARSRCSLVVGTLYELGGSLRAFRWRKETARNGIG